MPRHRTENSMLTKLENMEIGEELFTDKPGGYISDNLDTIKLNFPNRKYSQITIYTHLGSTFTSLKDFKKMICVTRLK